MAYDYAGPDFSDPDVTGNNAPMRDPDSSSLYTVESNIKQWIAAGASPAKMTLGVSLALTPTKHIRRHGVYLL